MQCFTIVHTCFAAVEGAGGRFLPEGAGVAVGGWEITCAKAPITGTRFRARALVDGSLHCLVQQCHIGPPYARMQPMRRWMC